MTLRPEGTLHGRRFAVSARGLEYLDDAQGRPLAVPEPVEPTGGKRRPRRAAIRPAASTPSKEESV